MVVPRRIVPATLLASASLIVLGAPGTTAATSKAKSVRGYVVPCLKADGVTFEYTAKPSHCILSDTSTQEPTLVPVNRIRWTTWTAARAKGTGTISGEGYKGKVVVTAAKPRRCSARRVIFTRVEVGIRLDDGIGRVAAIDASCPK